MVIIIVFAFFAIALALGCFYLMKKLTSSNSSKSLKWGWLLVGVIYTLLALFLIADYETLKIGGASAGHDCAYTVASLVALVALLAFVAALWRMAKIYNYVFSAIVIIACVSVGVWANDKVKECQWRKEHSQFINEKLANAAEKEEETPKEFVQGGNVYLGEETVPPNQYKSYSHTITYTIELFKDGTATWAENTTYSDGKESREQNWDGTWKKQTASKHDVEYTWYLIQVKAYSMTYGWGTANQGAIDENGNLYTFDAIDTYSNDRIMEKIKEGKYRCKLKIKR